MFPVRSTNATCARQRSMLTLDIISCIYHVADNGKSVTGFVILLSALYNAERMSQLNSALHCPGLKPPPQTHPAHAWSEPRVSVAEMWSTVLVSPPTVIVSKVVPKFDVGGRRLCWPSACMLLALKGKTFGALSVSYHIGW
jgi:hypothetical protein